MKRRAKTLQAKANKHQVSQRGTSEVWDVQSVSGSKYIVWAKRNQDLACNCKFSQFNYHKGRTCSHIIAVHKHQEDWMHAKNLSVWASKEDANRQHRPARKENDVWVTTRAAA